MAKFSGKLAVITGYEELLDDGVPTGVDVPVEKTYSISGTLVNANWRNENTDRINDDVKFSNKFSIIASPKLLNFIGENITGIYLVWYGMKLHISDIDMSSLPRIYITTDGLYNGK